MVLQPLEGYQVERSGTHAVALNLELDDELRREGLAREVVHAVQAARKNAGLDVEDRIALSARRATRTCSPPRASTRTTWPARRSPRRSSSTARRTSERAEIEGRPLPISVTLRRVKLPPPFDERPVLAPGGGRDRRAAGVRHPVRLRPRLERDPLLRHGGPLAIAGGFLAGVEHRERGRGVRARRDRRPRLRQLHPARPRDHEQRAEGAPFRPAERARVRRPRCSAAILGALGAHWRKRQERRSRPPPCARTASGAGSRAGSSSCTSRFFGIAPMIWCATWPCLKSSSIGIDITLYCAAVCGLSSTFSFTMRRSSRSLAELLQMRSDDAARAAPGGPEVDEYRLVGLDHFRLEVVVGDLVEIACHERSFGMTRSLQKI